MSDYGNGPDDSRRAKLHTRRPHRKTKTGCNTCKKRKIKCDEQKPECENCIKHSLNCEYGPTQGTFEIQLHSGIGAASLNLVDLELLHHFCTSTAFSVHDHPTIRTVWSTNVPRIGLQQDYVMHGILACAALHLAHSSSDRKDLFVNQARLHYHAGLQKGTPALATFSDENASAIYLFSILMVMYNIASARFRDPAVLSSQGQVAEWIILNRQSYGIVTISRDILFEGPLGQIFKIGTRRAELQQEASLDRFHGSDSLKQLSARIDENVQEPRIREAYQQSIGELVKCYAVVFALPANTAETSDVFAWPYRVKEEYLDLLQQSTQEALVILAYFAVLTKKLDSRWWCEGFGDHLMSMIYCLIDEEHMPWIQWPIEEMKWKAEDLQPLSQYPDPMVE